MAVNLILVGLIVLINSLMVITDFRLLLDINVITYIYSEYFISLISYVFLIIYGIDLYLKVKK
ncbi:MAG: hypothetical protein JXR81_03115 [Candidatus Goldbacteria bacterium]|nr:hypothetical protein [Candidatus Goldiibacteriota bacterium]